MKPRVFLATPFAENDGVDYNNAINTWLDRANVRLAQRCMADCFAHGEAPFAPHLLYTQPGILNDDIPDQRQMGITAGQRFLAICDYVVCYVDRGVSRGMRSDLKAAMSLSTPIVFRRLDGKMVGGSFLHENDVPHWPCGLCGRQLVESKAFR